MARKLVRVGANVNAELLRESKSTPMDWCYDTEAFQTNMERTSTFWENLWIGRLRVSEYLAEKGAVMRRKLSMPVACRFVRHACEGNWPRLFDEAWKCVPRELKTQDYLDRLLLQTCSDGNSEVASRLIEAGANVNCQWMEDEHWAGHTPLHKVAGNGDARTALVLVISGADLSIRDKEGRTSVIYAFTKQQDGMVSYLLSQGAPDNFPDKVEVPVITTFVHHSTQEEMKEELLSTVWTLKWTEEKDGSSERRVSMWVDGVRPGTRSGIVAARVAGRSQNQGVVSSWSKGRRSEGFHEAWSRILDRQRWAIDSAEEDEALLDVPDADASADSSDTSTDEDEE